MYENSDAGRKPMSKVVRFLISAAVVLAAVVIVLAVLHFSK